MAKSIAKSCPLCLSVNDPIDMLPVTMAHSTPPQTAPLYLCRLCVIQIMKSTLVSEVVDPSEVFGNVESGAKRDAGSGGDLDDRSRIPAVGDDQADTASARATDANPEGDEPVDEDVTHDD